MDRMSLYLFETQEKSPKGYRTFSLHTASCTADDAFCAIATDVLKQLCEGQRVLTEIKRCSWVARQLFYRAYNTIPSIELFRAFDLEREIFAGKGAIYTVTDGYNAPLTRLMTDRGNLVYQGNRYTAYVIDREMPHSAREVRLMHRYPDYRMRIEGSFECGSIQIALRDDERALLFDTVCRVCAEHGRNLAQC